MADQPLAIPIEKIKADFQQFLVPDHNRRIIFSGPFGIGKTYFLKEFFEEKENEYFPVFLRPINYSILSNEDVFKFIKYDILIQLINQNIVKIGRDLSVARISTAKNFVKNNKLLILKNLLKVIPNLGGVADGIDSFQELYKKYNEGLEKGQALQEDSVKTFISDLESNFLLEYDNVAKFIQEKLNKIDKKKVLIIDDLDRLDPEHIFRLFNVFSAHFDLVDDNSNKFGFDKIIFVCDIENIRKIFAHKYGGEVDFSGYIDKFYSTEIYKFLHDNVFEESIYPFVHEKLKVLNPTKLDDYLIEEFRFILNILFVTKQINIREIIRFSSFKSTILLTDNKYKEFIIPLSKVGAKENSTIVDYNFLIILKLLCDLIGDKEIVKRKISNVAQTLGLKTSIDVNNYYQIISELILFSDVQKHRFEVIRNPITDEEGKSSDELLFQIPDSKIEIKYKVEGTFKNYNEHCGLMWFRAELETGLPKISSIQFAHLFSNATNIVFENNLLN